MYKSGSFYLKGSSEGVDGGSVQMIAGLIQQQQVAGDQSKSCQGHTSFLTPTQITCRTANTWNLFSCQLGLHKHMQQVLEVGVCCEVPSIIVLSFTDSHDITSVLLKHPLWEKINLGQEAVMTEQVNYAGCICAFAVVSASFKTS